MIEGVDQKTEEQLLEEFCRMKDHSTLLGEQYSAAVAVKCAQKISNRMEGLGSGLHRVNQSLRDGIESTEAYSKKITRLTKWLVIVGVLQTICLAVYTYQTHKLVEISAKQLEFQFQVTKNKI